jgi:photosystem II stability/assembly factor-like uncharacterized protein
MNQYLFLATSDGLAACERKQGEWVEASRSLSGRRLSSVIAREGVVLAGSTDGIFRSDDLGKTWEEASDGLTARHVRWMAYHPDVSDLEFAGTEPAGIFVSEDGGGHWQERAEIPPLREKFGWFLPYSSGAGCVRGFAFHGERGYAAVEVGGALRSDDAGRTWRLADGSDGKPDLSGPPEPLIYPDVHSINTHPSSPDLVFAPTGGGFYRSSDGGAAWELLYDCYCRAVWVDPKDASHMVLSPADGVDRNGRIEATLDGGKAWELASDGLQVPWARGMVERFLQVDQELLAVLSNGQLLSAPLASLTWQRFLPAAGRVAAVAAMEGTQ